MIGHILRVLPLEKLKTMLYEASILVFFYPGRGLMQQSGNSRRVIVYGSHTFSATEKWYYQIEKETLALAWGAEKFQQYFLSIPVILGTDHNHLQQILHIKPLDRPSPRKELVVAHSLSHNMVSAEAREK
ncbi:hypothetical protein PR048_001265 [Dryococelus australis]|uniref:Reverse transcriptase RNase H-like domain-containing protein n=1 Tax=Dryococelus australis TaxID=614101 RepID=A0ABQ9IGV2_9NEOP|nr:hypothetical protein PR048_001265 [Dryococelus australis]